MDISLFLKLGPDSNVIGHCAFDVGEGRNTSDRVRVVTLIDEHDNKSVCVCVCLMISIRSTETRRENSSADAYLHVSPE